MFFCLGFLGYVFLIQVSLTKSVERCVYSWDCASEAPLYKPT